MLLLALLVQAAAAAPPERFSILISVGTEPCRRRDAAVPHDDAIVVCADALPRQALPLPDQAVSPLPQPANRDMTGAGALAMEGTPCAVRIGVCASQVNVPAAATAAIRLVQKLVAPNSCCEEAGEATNAGKLVSDAGKGIGRLFAHKPDRSKRIAIALDEPSTQGRVLP